DLVFMTKLADVAVPSETGITAVLYEHRELTGQSSMSVHHLHEVADRDVADAENTRATGIAFFLHRLPDFAVVVAPTVSLGGPVQDEAVDMIGAKVFQRTRHRLRDLLCMGSRRIVWKAMVLSTLIGEFRL